MRTKLSGVFVVLVSVALIGFAAGCGDDEESSESAATTTEETTAGGGGGGGETSVGMSEYEFDPSDLSVTAGDTLALTNDGQIPHNLTIVEGDDPIGGGAELAASDDIAGGDSGDVAVDVEAGDYSFLCTIPGHAEDGMVGKITVE